MTVVWMTEVLGFTVTVLVTVAVGAAAEVDEENIDEAFTLEDEMCVEVTLRAVEKDNAGTTGDAATLSCVGSQHACTYKDDAHGDSPQCRQCLPLGHAGAPPPLPGLKFDHASRVRVSSRF